MKDNFSKQSDKYAQYRPTYPNDLFDFINQKVKEKQCAWDCGTGNGQIAGELAQTFATVYATDISQQQIEHAVKKDSIYYSVQPAEKTTFENDTFDLIVVAQAIHWFDFEAFYQEVYRTAKNEALLCVVGYGRIEICQEIDAIITHLYQNIIGKYWDNERKYIDENYQTIPFPFEEIETPDLVMTQEWSLDHLIGYLNTWSAVKHFIKENQDNPINQIQLQLKEIWGNEQIRTVQFPLLIRAAQIIK